MVGSESGATSRRGSYDASKYLSIFDGRLEPAAAVGGAGGPGDLDRECECEGVREERRVCEEDEPGLEGAALREDLCRRRSRLGDRERLRVGVGVRSRKGVREACRCFLREDLCERLGEREQLGERRVRDDL